MLLKSEGELMNIGHIRGTGNLPFIFNAAKANSIAVFAYTSGSTEVRKGSVMKQKALS